MVSGIELWTEHLGSVAALCAVDGDLLEVGDPVGHDAISLRGSGEVLAVFGAVVREKKWSAKAMSK